MDKERKNKVDEWVSTNHVGKWLNWVVWSTPSVKWIQIYFVPYNVVIILTCDIFFYPVTILRLITAASSWKVKFKQLQWILSITEISNKTTKIWFRSENYFGQVATDKSTDSYRRTKYPNGSVIRTKIIFRIFSSYLWEFRM